MEARAARVNTEGWTLAEVVQVYAPEFQQVRPDGAVNSIDEALGDFTNGRTSPWAARYEIMDLDVRVYGCTSASVVGTAEVLPRGASAPMRWRFTNTWRNEDGAWRLARNQYVAVPRS